MNEQKNVSMQEMLAQLCIRCALCGKLKKAVFSKPFDKDVVKAVVCAVSIGGAPCLQFEYFHSDNKAKHKNIPLDSSSAPAIARIVAAFGQVNLLTELGDCEYRVSSKGKTVLLGGDKLYRRLEGCTDTVMPSAKNNKQKKYILDGSEPFLKLLGVSDANGRVYDKKQSKFRQVNRFLELVRDVEDKLPRGSIRICDLCCGKSYLSFAVYHYFANVKGYTVSMSSVDLKADVVASCSDVARRLGFDGLEFICCDINDYTPDTLPSLVVSLHACDIATDIVLKKAAEWQTDVILSTPCCHHELNHTVSCDTLKFITDYSILRQKLCDAATDALRLKRLEALGYTVAALELIDPDETPKNVMLRAVRRKGFDRASAEAQRLEREYLDAKKFLCGELGDSVHF